MTAPDGPAPDVARLTRAAGEPVATGVLKREAADFRVDEQLDIALDGEGEHLWLRIEKTGLNTHDAIQRVSQALGVNPRQIGYAGLKDRAAITRQWLSVAWPIKAELPQGIRIDGVRVLERQRHSRKLKRGAHDGNRFYIVVRDLAADRHALTAALERVGREGVPNYFGSQRFGRGGQNLQLAERLFAGARLSRNRRGFALSAARAAIFNAVLDRRVADGSWNRIIDGEAVMLDGSHSVFAADTETAAALAERLAGFDIHPSGPLAGQDTAPVVQGSAARLEQEVRAAFAGFVSGLERLQVDAARRALRLAVRDLDWSLEADRLTLSFFLPPGAFATVALRELGAFEEEGRPAAD